MSSLDYLLGDELTLVTAPVVLGAELSLRSGPLEAVDRRFYDTFDRRLRSAELACMGENGRLVLLDTGAGAGRELAAVSLSGDWERVLAIDLPEGAMRDALLPVIDVRALSPLAHIRSRLRTLAVLDDEQKTVVRIVVEQPSVLIDERRRVPLTRRLRLAPVRGYDKALARVRRTLEHRLGLHAAEITLVDEAVRVAGDAPSGFSSKVEVELRADSRADAATAAVLRRLLEVMQATLPGTLADVDAEFLHDFRVAVRRSRAVQRELKGVFPPEPLRRFRTDFRWLQQSTGAARDLDVYVLEFNSFRRELPEGPRKDLDPLLAVLRHRRAAAHAGMAQALGSERAQSLLADWATFIGELGSGSTAGPFEALGPLAGEPIGAIAGGRISHVYRRMVEMGRAIDDSSPAEQYHDLRKQGKELRYLLELFAAPLYPEEIVKPMVRALKALQDTLGRHQDREIQVAMLRSLGDEVAAQPGGAAGLMAMGMLVERLEEEEAAARAEFGQRFAAFASRAQRKLVRDAFG